MSIRIRAYLATLASSLFFAATGYAQLSDVSEFRSSQTQVATLEDQLINRLRATTDDRKAYIRLIGTLITNGTLDSRQVFAIERYAIRKNPQFPFPFFERAMRFEAEKRGIELPPVQLLAGSASTYQPRRTTR